MNPSDSSVTESTPTPAYDATRLEEETTPDEQKTTPVKRCLSFMDIRVFRAAQEGDVDSLREHSDRLLQLLTPTKNTVLHVYIACAGSANLTKFLPKSSDVVRGMLKMSQRLLLQENKSGDTALHLAARHGRADLVGVLIQAAKDWHGDIEEGTSSTEVCSRFLIRKLNKENNTALHEAVRFDHVDVVKILIEEDTEFLYPVNSASRSPIYMASERGYCKSVFEMLYAWPSPTYQGPHGLTALHNAAAYGYEYITERLLEKEMKLAKTADEVGNTPLYFAALWGQVSIVKQILECDKSPAYTGNMYEVTPVHLAAAAGRVDVLEQFIFYCPDSFELVDHKGRSALHFAIINNRNEVEEFVRKDPWLSSILLNGKDSVGNTLLHHIATSQVHESLEFISDYRVDKMAVNEENMNALDIIVRDVDGKKEKGIILPSTTIRWMAKLTQCLAKSGARAGQRLPRDYADGSRIHVKKHGQESEFKEIKEAHMVVSTLIATVTFAAGFTVPGGYQSEKGPDQGFAVLSRNAAFKAFVITNTLAMSLSSCAVLIRFMMLWRRHEVTLRYGLKFHCVWLGCNGDCIPDRHICNIRRSLIIRTCDCGFSSSLACVWLKSSATSISRNGNSFMGTLGNW